MQIFSILLHVFIVSPGVIIPHVKTTFKISTINGNVILIYSDILTSVWQIEVNNNVFVDKNDWRIGKVQVIHSFRPIRISGKRGIASRSPSKIILSDVLEVLTHKI